VLVGITQRIEHVSSYDEWRDAIDQRLIEWVIKSSLFPVPIPNNLVDINQPNGFQYLLTEWLQTLNIEALLLSGGSDIGDSPQRDLTEKNLLLWAEKNRIPVLGICRGMQMMGVWSGESLIEVEGHVRTRHQLQITDDDFKLSLGTVNSYHNQVLQKCPLSFKILAKSTDGNIEAMAHRELPWEGWMWHPERESVFSKNDLDRFNKLIERGKK